MDQLVSTQWLAQQLANDGPGMDDLRIVDATLFLPGTARDAAQEHAAGHIPGAVFLDLATLIDHDDPRPGMVPPADQFAARVSALGIGDDSRILLYDDSPLRSAARAWWLFRLFGARNVAILDGGLARWKADGHPVETGMAAPAPASFTPRADLSTVRTRADIEANLTSDAAQLVDARGMKRFTGEEAEPRPGMASGHIPGSACLPYSTLFDAQGCWKRGDELRDIFRTAGVDLSRPLIATCGSGVTAADLLFAATLIGKHDVTLYDGSWSEWGADPATPKATGA